MRILITGCDGQLGTELRRCLGAMEAEAGPVPGAYSGASLDNARLREVVGDCMRPWRDALATYLERLPELVLTSD